MKKNFTLMIAAATIFAACSKDNYPQESDAPAHAASDKTWVIESADGSIKQTWSDAIQIPECNKADYDGGSEDAPKVDCRNYTLEGKTYYYYSWPYVDTYANRLCPSPWRVPARQDFRDLDKAFGGNDNSSLDPEYVAHFYVNLWGGTYGGEIESDGTHDGPSAKYWSSTVADDTNSKAYHLHFYPNVLHTSRAHKYKGFQVRCVK
jgi:uncharacterized protein (TIGR02145 family)